MRVLHVITGLGQGGAERQLSNLVRARDGFFSSAIFSIYRPGVIGQDIGRAGVPIFSGEASGLYSVGWLAALRATLKAWRPDLVSGWLYHGNVASSLSRAFGYHGPVVWNVRHSVQDLALERVGTKAVIRAGAWLSSGPTRIIYNSEAAASQHEALGYRSEKRCLVANGFDVERFRPNPVARLCLRRSLGVSDQELLLGIIGRSHPMKNHVGWVRAFARLVEEGAPVRCVMMGAGIDDPAGPVVKAVESLGLSGRIHLFPGRDDPESVYPALDLLVMPSQFGEGVPNVVGEAMASGVPALVTDVGDSARLVGDTGFVARGSDSVTLAKSTAAALQFGAGGLAEMGRRARTRIVEDFELKKAVAKFQAVFADAIQEHNTGGC